MYTGGMMYRRSWILTSLAGASLLGQNKSAEEEKKLSADELKDAANEMGEPLAEAARELGCASTKPLDQLRFLLAKTKEVGPVRTGVKFLSKTSIFPELKLAA